MKNQDSLHEQGKFILKVLLKDLQIAKSSWAHVSALSNDRAELDNAANILGQDFRYIKITFARDTILALFRISDDPGENRATLCRLSKIIQKPDFVFDNPALINSFTDIVPARWGKQEKPAKIDLYEWRQNMRDVRDNILAHSTLTDLETLPSLCFSTRYIELGLKLHEELILMCCEIFLGADMVTERGLAVSVGDASQFWDLAQEGFIRRAEENHQKFVSAMNRLT